MKNKLEFFIYYLSINQTILSSLLEGLTNSFNIYSMLLAD